MVALKGTLVTASDEVRGELEPITVGEPYSVSFVVGPLVAAPHRDDALV